MNVKRAIVHLCVVAYFGLIPLLILVDAELQLLFPLYVVGIPVFLVYYRFVEAGRRKRRAT